MDADTRSELTPEGAGTIVERTSERELAVSRTVGGPERLVFEAWTRPELFMRWWVPRSFPVSLLSCEMDVRVGGGYRLVFGHEDSTMEFFGRYLEVAPPTRLAWTNDEGAAAGPVTSVTFEDTGRETLVTVRDLYPSEEALDAAIASGSTGISAMPETLGQLDDLLAELGAGA